MSHADLPAPAHNLPHGCDAKLNERDDTTPDPAAFSLATKLAAMNSRQQKELVSIARTKLTDELCGDWDDVAIRIIEALDENSTGDDGSENLGAWLCGLVRSAVESHVDELVESGQVVIE